MTGTDILYFSGMAIPVVYILLYLVGGALRPGYSHILNSVSELLSPGAPNRRLLMSIQILYAFLHILFGLGVLRFSREITNDQTIGRLGVWFIVALGITTFGTVIFPQDAKESRVTLAGQLHKILVFGGLE